MSKRCSTLKWFKLTKLSEDLQIPRDSKLAQLLDLVTFFFPNAHDMHIQKALRSSGSPVACDQNIYEARYSDRQPKNLGTTAGWCSKERGPTVSIVIAACWTGWAAWSP